MSGKFRKPPAHNAGDAAWVKWVDEVCPLNCRSYSGPMELFPLTRLEARTTAAGLARAHFAKQGPKPVASKATEQKGFDFGGGK